MVTTPVFPDESAMCQEIGKEMERVSSIISKQLADVISNSRWYSTLVIGEITGISQFAKSTHWWTKTFFVLSLIALFISIISLIYSTVNGQDIKYNIETKLAEFASKLPFVSFAGASPEKLQEIKEQIQGLFSAGRNSDALTFSRIGLWLFLTGSILGGMALVFN